MQCGSLTDGRACLRCGARVAPELARRPQVLLAAGMSLGLALTLGSLVRGFLIVPPPAPPPVPIVQPAPRRAPPYHRLPELAPLPVVPPPRPPAVVEPLPMPDRSKRTGFGKFACATKPLGAEVWIDGRNTGEKTPISLSRAIPLPVGPHRVHFVLNGTHSGAFGVAVEEGVVAKLTGVVIERN